MSGSARITLIALFAFLAACPAVNAEGGREMPGIVGKVNEKAEPRIIALDHNPTAGLLGQAKDNFPAATFLRLHLVVIAPSPLDGVALTVLDAFGTEVETISLSGSLGLSDTWTLQIPGSGYKVRALGPRQPDGSTVIVRDVDTNSDVIEPESLVGADDMVKITQITDPRLLAVARATAKYVFQKDGKMATCTAFLIGAQRMITNQHCMPDPATCKTAIVQFDFNDGIVPAVGTQRHCSATKAIDYDFDFAVFDIDQPPPEPAITPLVLGTSSPSPAASPMEPKLVVVEHPSGKSKRVSIKNCALIANPVAGRSVDTDFTHSCDSLPGSSGAAMLDADYHVVGVHHYGKSIEQPTHNRAVRIESITARLRDAGLLPP